jgi:hypothetical protein
MDKLKQTGQNLGRVLNSRCGRSCLCHTIERVTKTAKPKVENLEQTTFRLSPIRFNAPHQEEPQQLGVQAQMNIESL